MYRGPGATPPSVVGLPLLRTFPGRLFLLTTGLVAIIVAVQAVVAVPLSIQVVRRAAAFAWLVAAGWLAVLAISQNRKEFLWRVRRKLLLSYAFLGVVPVVLVLAFWISRLASFSTAIVKVTTSPAESTVSGLGVFVRVRWAFAGSVTVASSVADTRASAGSSAVTPAVLVNEPASMSA